MKDLSSWRGIFTIPPTPFHPDLSIDTESLDRVLRFIVNSGSHGLVATANASEAGFLSETERSDVIARTIAVARGKLPVIVGVSAPTARQAAEAARFAETQGADAVMAMPPTLAKPRDVEILEFYRVLAGATSLPIVVQNWGGLGGTPMSAQLLARIAEELPACSIVKEETDFAGPLMSETKKVSTRPLHFLSGKSCRYLIDDHRRGFAGSMPAAEIPEVQVKIWDFLEQKMAADAHALYAQMLPLLTLEIGYGVRMFKAVLKRRGIIHCDAVRQTGLREFDDSALAYLDDLLEKLTPHFDADYPLPS